MSGSLPKTPCSKRTVGWILRPGLGRGLRVALLAVTGLLLVQAGGPRSLACDPPEPVVETVWSSAGDQSCHAYLDTEEGPEIVDGQIFYLTNIPLVTGENLDNFGLFFDGVDHDSFSIYVDGNLVDTEDNIEDTSFPSSTVPTSPCYDGVPPDLASYTTKVSCTWTDDETPPGVPFPDGTSGSSNDGTVGPISVTVVDVPPPTATISASRDSVYPGQHVVATCSVSPLSVYGNGCSLSAPGFSFAGGNPPSWNWDNGTVSIDLVAGDNSGSRTLTLAVSGSYGGCESQGTTVTCSITILSMPPDEYYYDSYPEA